MKQNATASGAGSAGVVLRSFLAWLLFIFIESVLGTLRTLLLEPRIGIAAAKRIGLAVGSLVVLLIAVLLIRWVNARGGKQLIGIGIFWAALTFGFELALGRLVFQRSWNSVLTDYDLVHGGLMPVALVVMIFAPLIANAIVRRKT